MNNRWKMNRIGFVNFWLYDEEDFEFEDGKLLLRGQNGSGKSITTQSFIPFVLDGDRTPSRLDPFGSSDRRMEYYFLGEEGRDEATGYLFLEFKKEDTEEKTEEATTEDTTENKEKEPEKTTIFYVTDPDLLALTGGVIQGMSGSPILQNGRLIGAVTHVFVNDPAKGYGIFAENMIEH